MKVDERLLERRVDEEISIGDFFLSGGEIAAMALVDAVVRQLPGALGDENSALEESFADGCSIARSTRGQSCTPSAGCPKFRCPGTTRTSGAGD